MADIQALLRAFPGIVTSKPNTQGSHAHADGEKRTLALVFTDDEPGKVAQLTTQFLFSRMGNGRRLDGKAPVPGTTEPACSCGTKGAVWYVCSAEQLAVFVRALTYASATPMGPPRPKAKTNARPLFVLLSHALLAFERDYDRRRDRRAQPSLGVWGNALRVVGDGASQRELSERAVLAHRGARAILRDLERMGWVKAQAGQRPARFALTSAGWEAREAAVKGIALVERDWEERSAGSFAALRKALAALTRQFDIALPWHLTGYGPADVSVTGGDHVPAQTGPPRIPHHGQDWPVVLRRTGCCGGGGRKEEEDSHPPLPALLSQALAMYTIDFEWDIRGYGAGLAFTANLLRHIPDGGLPLAQAFAEGDMDVKGNGKSGSERHLATVVEAGAPRDGQRRVHLTPKGKSARDSFAHRVLSVERDWHSRFGPCADELRVALEAMDGEFGENLPDYPNTTAWYAESMVVAAAAHRAGAAHNL